MCGILGIINRDNKPLNPHQLRQMTNTMTHRGPDDSGFLLIDPALGRTFAFDQHERDFAALTFQPTVGLGHRRLSILDIQTGKQPMCNEDGTVWIIFNGEIYNHKELRRELQSRGHQFKTYHSDTETIIHAYEEFGEDCLQFLRGMFAFGIIDINNKQLFLARDRAGKKPLYFYKNSQTLIFASEIKAIIEDHSIARVMDMTSLGAYLTLSYIPSPKTIYKDIYKLKPGHYVSIGLSSKLSCLTQKEYWRTHFEPDESLSEAQWCERLHHTLTEAIKIRMRSDVPLGAFLSGGIDSSIIVALMSQLSRQPIKTFSIGFEEPEYNELTYARQVAQTYNTEHYEQVVKPNAIEILPKLAWQYDEPLGDTSVIPTYYVSQMASQHVKVVLSGDGGDEIFVGYDRYAQAYRYYTLIHRIPSPLHKIFLEMSRHVVPRRLKHKKMAVLLSLSPMEVYRYMVAQPIWHTLLNPEVWTTIESEPGNRVFTDVWNQANRYDIVTQMQYVDLKTYLAENILVKVDRATMLNALEVRIPFLDHPLMTLAGRIPVQLKFNGANRKYILKQIMLPYFSRDFLSRKKRGFGLPLEFWFRGELKHYAHEMLLQSTSFSRNYINPTAVERLLKDNKCRTQHFSRIIWKLLFLECWGRQYMPDH